MHRSEDMLGRTLEPEVLSLDFIAIFAWFEAIHRIIGSGFDHIGRQHREERLGRNTESVLLDDTSKNPLISEGIHDPVDERELEADEVTFEIGKSRSSDIGCTFFIDPSSYSCYLCMIADGK